ncbi:polysaccharide lyase family 8 super-sandwich domain-containing protein [Flavobacterium sp. WC2509]|uniref:polysaccharide lyase family 8 super-sandwich domain-containing protein n=1 Tax=Flavobacterium sp. WC2509 TaxID=3461406 RepID=UPI004044D216
MKKNYVILLLSLYCCLAYSQQKYNFDSSVPANFSSSGTTPLSLSTEHLKDGTNSLKWNAASGNVLKADNLGITAAQTFLYGANNAQFFIYSQNVSNDMLIFRFYDNNNNLMREGHMLLNYKGWRDYHRSYRSDYNFGADLPGFALTRMEIIYQPENPASTTTLYFDAFTMYGDNKGRTPGPHMKLDVAHFVDGDASKMVFFEGLNASALICNMQTPAVAPASTVQEQTDAGKVKALYPRTVFVPLPADVTAAKDYVTACNITRNTDGSINGKGLTTELDVPATLITIATHVGNLSRAALKNNDTDAKTKLLLFIEYLLDQGLAEGGRNSMQTNTYTNCRDFPPGFLLSLPALATASNLQAEVIKMLKWSNQYNVIYHPGTPYLPVNTDFVHVKMNFLFELAGWEPSIDNQVRDLKAISRYLSLFSNVTQGSRDGIKPDGSGMHHGTAYPHYMYAFNTYADRAYSLKGTVYKITQQAYNNIANTYKTQLLQTSKGQLSANAVSGRAPFEAIPITQAGFGKMVEVGGDLIGTAYEPNLAALYNYIYQTNTYPVAAASLDGFYHFNYGNQGVKRMNNWIVMMKGLTDKLWGTEIYTTENRYGRYQSYGALEVMYNGDRTASGIPAAGGNGWDWNMPPGSTTVQIPYTELQPKIDRADEYNQKAFAGALSLGQDGIFAMDFSENAGTKYTANNLKFHKSVFNFDNVFVCLGSGIGSTNAVSNTTTNLFQSALATTNPDIYVNSSAAVSDVNYSNTLSTASASVWLVNGQTTGYYVPVGGGDITVTRGVQTTPVNSSKTGTPTASANFSKAYIGHGTSPSNAKYQFVMVPGTTPQDMSTLSTQINAGQIYQVLSQTDNLHAVKYLPENSTSYAFFSSATNINIGKVNSISGEALVGIKEIDGALEVTLNNPNLNTVADDATEWRSTAYNVTLKLNGKWKAATNPNNVGLTADGVNTTLAFSVIDGVSATIKLVVDNQAPTVSITSPTADTSYNAPANIVITADSADADGAVSKVEFYQGGTKLGESLTSPYSFEWNNVTAGSYTLTAKSIDNNGAVTTSTAVNINVITILSNNDFDKEENRSNVVVYPNSVHDTLYVKVSKLEENATITVYNMLGSKLRDVRFTNLTQEVFVGDLAVGTYVVIIKNGAQIMKNTIIKE